MRYIPHTPQDVETMLETIGVTSTEDLFSTIPKEAQLKKPLNLPRGLSEIELLKEFEAISKKNDVCQWTSFLGAGAYAHFIPSIVDYLSMQGGFLTAYTPYQPEISQGTLQSIFEFQTMMCHLTGMGVSNACMYDGATALAEACLMAKRLHPQKSQLLMAQTIHPEYQEVCKTYLYTQDLGIEKIPYDPVLGSLRLDVLEKQLSQNTLALLIQHPNFFGTLEDLETIKSLCQKHDTLLIVSITEPLSMAYLEPPGHYGADLVVGEAQSFGNPIAFGGPHVGFFTTQSKYIRAIPGRIVGETVDEAGQRAFTLTLSTREQHIRREKATSNICTNEALLATRTTIYLATLGEQGLRQLAHWNHSLATTLSKKMKSHGSLKFQGPFFNEVVVQCKKPYSGILKNCESRHILPGLPLETYYPELKNCLLVCTTELHSEKDLEVLYQELS